MKIFGWGRKERQISRGQQTAPLHQGKNGPVVRDGIRVDEEVIRIDANLRNRSKKHLKLEQEMTNFIGVVADEDLPTIYAAMVQSAKGLGYNCVEPQEALRIIFK